MSIPDPIIITNRSDLTRLFQDVHHVFKLDARGDHILETKISIGEVIYADGEKRPGEFTTTVSAEPVKPLVPDQGLEATPINRVFLMTKNQNLLLQEIEQALLASNDESESVVSAGGVAIDVSPLRDEG